MLAVFTCHNVIDCTAASPLIYFSFLCVKNCRRIFPSFNRLINRDYFFFACKIMAFSHCYFHFRKPVMIALPKKLRIQIKDDDIKCAGIAKIPSFFFWKVLFSLARCFFSYIFAFLCLVLAFCIFSPSPCVSARTRNHDAARVFRGTL